MATTNLLKCSYCGKPQTDVKKLVCGPGVYICDKCVELCNKLLVVNISGETPLTNKNNIVKHENIDIGTQLAELNCSFCKKPNTNVEKLIAGTGVSICNECVDICNELLNHKEN